VATVQQAGHPFRLLVAIASYGNKNLGFLKKLIQQYQSMTMDVDVIVFSDTHKDLPADVKVMVGLPSKNPWSLPFAHKAYFAKNCDRYDLFVYSEDDMKVTEENIQAFLRVAPQLKPDEIAGYLRYECDSSGARSLPDVHGTFHWKVESVKRRGADTIAEFTNEHAGFYILTQSQLRRAIASGGFLTEPYEERYGMLETAATDPYTRCGFRKVICISGVEDFLIHHLPDRYVGQLGIPFSVFKEQIHTLMEICNDNHPASSLCEVESKTQRRRWSKFYDEKPSEELLKMVSDEAKTILSVGCGSGAAETNLSQRGMNVTALPLDSVVGAAAARLGIEIVHGNLEEGMNRLTGRKFDCVLVTNLLHLQADSRRFLEMCGGRVGEGGTLLVAGPNFNRIPNWIQRNFGVNGHRQLRSFAESGINTASPGTFAAQIKKFGFGPAKIQWFNHELFHGKLGWIKVPFGRLTARNWILQARRQSVSSNHRSA
jgi:2-polyprenyl-3-methyl-5-hydroxy-6-metoxy-1,4-benzoquinol methylase